MNQETHTQLTPSERLLVERVQAKHTATLTEREIPAEQPEAKRTQALYVGNIPYNTTEREIRKIFRPYAPIHAVIMIKDKNGQPRGFGFIVLDELKAEAALNDLNNKVYGGRHLRISKASGCASRRRERCVTATGAVAATALQADDG